MECSYQSDDSLSLASERMALQTPVSAALQCAKDGMYSRSLSLFDDASINELLFIQSVEAGVSLTKPPEAVTSPFSLKSDSLEEPTSSLT